ncbi:hypothetical protein GCM10020260_04470 [Nesterenkonia halobia]|uniref:Uncharacterized protein n=1 Tax=Nesterenkonia halobia TaxID=37922 RepID=A0ABP6R9V1_9MICC
MQSGTEHPSQAQCRRIEEVITADVRREEIFIAFSRTPELKSVYQSQGSCAGRGVAVKVFETFQSYPVPEFAKLRRPLHR